jgi:hypothetical protein
MTSLTVMLYFVIYCSTFEAQEFSGEVKYIHFRFELSTAVIAKSTVLWYVTPCILVALYHNTLNHASSNITLRKFLCFLKMFHAICHWF